jgi:iron complex outermembrane receptor protein
MKGIAILLAAAVATPALGQTRTAAVESVVVLGTLPDSDIGLAADKVPGALQSFSADQITAQHGGSLLSALSAQTAGVSLSDVQGNGLLQNLRFHGFDASPLQGTPQGLAVYQNGVRLNEAFGDTVNWDAIPQTAIARVEMWSSNPVFGLNALGGAVDMVMKNGFTHQGASASLQGGSYGHGQAGGEWGMTDGDFSFYGAAEGVSDAGWRYHSQSNLARLYADAGWRFGDSEIHIVASGAATSLGVIGPTPVQLTQRNSKAVYTFPQITRNSIASLAVNGKTRLDGNWQLEGSAYLRVLKQRHVDGNDAEFERCSASSSFAGRLCLEDDGFARPVPFTGAAALNFRNQFAILDQNNASIPFTGAVYGTLDRTFTDSASRGFTVQVTGDAPLFGLPNYVTAGVTLDASGIGFRSTSTLAGIRPSLEVAVDPALAGSGSIIHANGNIGYAPVTLAATTSYYGFYAVDALDLTDALTVTLGLRANAADIITRDRSGLAAELNGSHGYGHVNPLAGLTYKLGDAVTLFGGYSQSNRAPTPLELDCADPLRPCLLEGSLVGDPPLSQVVAHSYQAGLRGAAALGDGKLDWSVSLFRTDSDNDIVSLASTLAGRGYFANVPSTRRQGLDLSAQYSASGWSAYASYSHLDATYQFTGALASPNNPAANASGNVSVTPGKRIPLNPANTVRAGGDVDVVDGVSLGGELLFTGSQYFEGDPSNVNPRLPSTMVVNLRTAWQINPRWQLFGLVDNLFDNRDALYGSYFEPGGTAGLVTPALTDARTLTLRQPITFQLGLKLRF